MLYFILFWHSHKRRERRFELVTFTSWNMISNRLSYPYKQNYNDIEDSSKANMVESSVLQDIVYLLGS